MATWQTYKNDLLVPDSTVGDAGANLRADLMLLRDYSPKSDFAKTRDPTTSDNAASAGKWENGSLWGNAVNHRIFICVNAAVGTWVNLQAAAQVNSDWNATSGVAEILNKPSLATVATTGQLQSLVDTNITSPTNGQVLEYNSGTGKWVPADASTTGRVSAAPGNNGASGNSGSYSGFNGTGGSNGTGGNSGSLAGNGGSNGSDASTACSGGDASATGGPGGGGGGVGGGGSYGVGGRGGTGGAFSNGGSGGSAGTTTVVFDPAAKGSALFADLLGGDGAPGGDGADGADGGDGANGGNGSDGASGGNGANGGNAYAACDVDGNPISANGGPGGSGGQGGSGGNGGNGGRGGDAGDASPGGAGGAGGAATTDLYAPGSTIIVAGFGGRGGQGGLGVASTAGSDGTPGTNAESNAGGGGDGTPGGDGSTGGPGSSGTDGTPGASATSGVDGTDGTDHPTAQAGGNGGNGGNTLSLIDADSSGCALIGTCVAGQGGDGVNGAGGGAGGLNGGNAQLLVYAGQGCFVGGMARGTDASGSSSLGVDGIIAVNTGKGCAAFGYAQGQQISVGGRGSVVFGTALTGPHTAQGDGAFAAGCDNYANANYATALGHGTTANGEAAMATGASTQATGEFSFAANYGSIASGVRSFAAGGICTASGPDTTAFGDSCTSSGISSFATGTSSNATGPYSMALGYLCVSNGQASFVCGQNNHADGTAAFVSGAVCYADVPFSSAGGFGAKTTLQGQRAAANEHFSNPGDCQRFDLQAKVITTDNTPTVMDNFASPLTLPDYTSWLFFLEILARRTDSTADRAAYKMEGVISRNNAAASTTIHGSPAVTTIYTSDGSLAVAVTADTSAGALKITVTGVNGKTIRWTTVLRAVQIQD